VLQPGPLHAFYDRTRARRGHGKAIVATARKLAILFWCMLTRGEDYAHQQPSLTKKKLRRLEITAGAPKYATTARGIWSSNLAIRQAERKLAEQAEASYKRLVKDQQAGAPGVPPLFRTPDRLRPLGAKGWCPRCPRPDPRTPMSSAARRCRCCAPAARRAS
jgi:hypothetical protein